MKPEIADISVPGHWGCSSCDENNNVPVENFRGSWCKHIICEKCIIGVINRNKLLKKTSVAESSVIEVTCPCKRCRGTFPISQVWYEEKNARVISLCDDEDDQGQNYYTAAVAQVKTESKSETPKDQAVVSKGMERGGLKPLFEKGDAVYALWEESGKRTWHPGKILSYKQFDSKSRYGDIREYVVKFDDGDVGSTEDYNVFPLEDYLLGQSHEGEEEWKWKGVKNVTDGRSSDEWAKVVGWYVANIDGNKQKFSTLAGALRAYDASVIKKKGNQTKESDLNLPQEYQVATPKKRERDVNVATPSPLPLLSSNSYADDDDDVSRFSDIAIEQRMTKRIKVERDDKIHLPPQLEGDQNDDQFWSARDAIIECTEEAFKKKSIFHLNSFVDAKRKQNEGFGPFVEQGIATPCFHDVPEDLVPMIADMAQKELREAMLQHDDWERFYDSRASAAGQVAMWLKRCIPGSFIVMRHEYERCHYCPKWLKERTDASDNSQYIGPVYIIGVVTRKIKPYSDEEAFVNTQMRYFKGIPHLCLVDWKRIGYKRDLKDETQKYINRICQPTVVNICNDFEKVYTDGATAQSLRQDLWDNSSPFELVVEV